MRLICLINAFNEAEHIEKCIGSIHDYVDEVWLYDGAYKQFPNTKPYSTDGMLEIASKFPKVKIFGNNNQVWPDQITKRTVMFSQGREGDIFFVLDGDEYCTNPEIIRDYLDCDVGWVWSLSNLYRYPYMKARIFKYMPGMHYAGRHHWLYDGDNNFITSDQKMNLRFKHIDTPIRIFNYRSSSKPEMQDTKLTFLKNRAVDECRYRSELDVYDKTAFRVVPHPHKAGSPCRPASILRYSKDIEYTYTLMFSRPWAVDRFFENLNKMQFPDRTEIVCVIDTDDYDFVDQVVANLKDTRFDSIKYFVTDNPKLEEFKGVAFRRQRIIDNWHILLTEARGEIIFAGEDDSLPQPDAYIKLLGDLKENNADFVQGNIIGRWKANMYPAWKVLTKDNQPYKVMSGVERTGVEQIDAVGWYCFAAYTDVCRKYPMMVDSTLPLGPDVNFGYKLSSNGFKLLHDWDVKVEHFGEDFSLLPGRDPAQVFTWQRSGNLWVNI